MSVSDSIPIVSQVKSLGYLLSGNKQRAREVQGVFLRRCPVVKSVHTSLSKHGATLHIKNMIAHPARFSLTVGGLEVFKESLPPNSCLDLPCSSGIYALSCEVEITKPADETPSASSHVRVVRSGGFEVDRGGEVLVILGDEKGMPEEGFFLAGLWALYADQAKENRMKKKDKRKNNASLEENAPLDRKAVLQPNEEDEASAACWECRWVVCSSCPEVDDVLSAHDHATKRIRISADASSDGQPTLRTPLLMDSSSESAPVPMEAADKYNPPPKPPLSGNGTHLSHLCDCWQVVHDPFRAASPPQSRAEKELFGSKPVAGLVLPPPEGPLPWSLPSSGSLRRRLGECVRTPLVNLLVARHLLLLDKVCAGLESILEERRRMDEEKAACLEVQRLRKEEEKRTQEEARMAKRNGITVPASPHHRRRRGRVLQSILDSIIPSRREFLRAQHVDNFGPEQSPANRALLDAAAAARHYTPPVGFSISPVNERGPARVWPLSQPAAVSPPDLKHPPFNPQPRASAASTVPPEEEDSALLPSASPSTSASPLRLVPSPSKRPLPIDAEKALALPSLEDLSIPDNESDWEEEDEFDRRALDLLRNVSASPTSHARMSFAGSFAGEDGTPSLRSGRQISTNLLLPEIPSASHPNAPVKRVVDLTAPSVGGRWQPRPAEQHLVTASSAAGVISNRLPRARKFHYLAMHSIREQMQDMHKESRDVHYHAEDGRLDVPTAEDDDDATRARKRQIKISVRKPKLKRRAAGAPTHQVGMRLQGAAMAGAVDGAFGAVVAAAGTLRKLKEMKEDARAAGGEEIRIRDHMGEVARASLAGGAAGLVVGAAGAAVETGVVAMVQSVKPLAALAEGLKALPTGALAIGAVGIVCVGVDGIRLARRKITKREFARRLIKNLFTVGLLSACLFLAPGLAIPLTLLAASADAYWAIGSNLAELCVPYTSDEIERVREARLAEMRTLAASLLFPGAGANGLRATAEAQRRRDGQSVSGDEGAIEVLMVATASDIRTAFRRLTLTCHPDKGGDEEMFRAAALAFAVLTEAHIHRQFAQGCLMDG